MGTALRFENVTANGTSRSTPGPSGSFINQVTGTEPDGTAIYRTRELETGEVIASGTTDVAGYGTTAVERAQFIVKTIRTHLTPTILQPLSRQTRGDRRPARCPGPVVPALWSSSTRPVSARGALWQPASRRTRCRPAFRRTGR